tara:strand:+ start:4507 stop:5994 length:1488 start_codon:yes stop_codon:yes gene_type:complete
MRSIKSVCLYLFLPFVIFSFSLTPLSAQIEECDNLNKVLIEYGVPKFNYHENRNDIGVFYDFEWDSKNKIVIVKRNNDGYPIVRFSLFDKENILSGKIIKAFNGTDLSKINDYEVKRLHRSSGKIELQLDNDKIINLNSKPYKLNDFKLTDFILNSIHNINTSKGILEISLDSYITNNRKDLLDSLIKNNDQSLLDTGKHTICHDLKKKLVWPLVSVNFNEYRYDADVREGLKNKEKLVNSVFDLTYDHPDFRSMRTEKGIFFIRQDFDFKKFPFDTQKLIITLESGTGSKPNKNFANRYNKEGSVTFLTPEKGPFINLEKYQKKNYLKNWKVISTSINSREIIDNNYFDKWNNRIITHNENVLDIEIEIERYVAHYLYKIILPVFLILCVAWYVLWIPTRKYEARLNTSIIALLSLIAYNFVFQDDIPKLEYLTDLDWYILLSYVFCCIPVFISITSSKLGTKNQKNIIIVNKIIKKWGILIYFVIIFAIFKII